MKEKFIELYMDWAKRVAQMSHAKRLQVGAIIVKDNSVISYGYNGMPAGWDNNCEDRHYIDPTAGGWLDAEEIQERWPFEDQQGRYCLTTRPEVLHAERNALDKLTKRGGIGSNNASLFCTHAPCLECAKSIYSAGITELYYGEQYRSSTGLEFLEKCNVKIKKI